jgi:hypothetical protein
VPRSRCSPNTARNVHVVLECCMLYPLVQAAKAPSSLRARSMISELAASKAERSCPHERSKLGTPDPRQPDHSRLRPQQLVAQCLSLRRVVSRPGAHTCLA